MIYYAIITFFSLLLVGHFVRKYEEKCLVIRLAELKRKNDK